MFLIEDLIKVSVMALNGIERGGDRPLKEPERSISEVLKHTLDLLPLEGLHVEPEPLQLQDEMIGQIVDLRPARRILPRVVVLAKVFVVPLKHLLRQIGLEAGFQGRDGAALAGPGAGVLDLELENLEVVKVLRRL